MSLFSLAHSVQLMDVAITPLCFMSLFYPIMAPAMTFGEMYAVLFSAQMAATTMGFVIGGLVPAKNVAMTGIVVAVCVILIAGVNPAYSSFSPALKFIASLTIMQRYVAALLVKELLSAPEIELTTMKHIIRQRDYTETAYEDGIFAMWMMTLVFLLVAFLLMAYDRRKHG